MAQALMRGVAGNGEWGTFELELGTRVNATETWAHRQRMPDPKALENVDRGPLSGLVAVT